MQVYNLPTGSLFVDHYSKGKLETLSIGDYGKSCNVKADFLGYHRELDGVPNGACMPLSEKWVVTLSTQYGCPMACTFCDVPKIPFKGNATFGDLHTQLYAALRTRPDVRYTERLNIHFARMGEPILNPAVYQFSLWLAYHKRSLQDELDLRVEVIHPVLTTSLPRSFRANIAQRLEDWCEIKNGAFNGQAGLQISVNSTSEEQRNQMFAGRQLPLEEFAAIAARLPPPLGRKYCLNFAYATGYEVDGVRLRQMFDPAKWMCKITPIHNNNACRENGIETVGGYTSFHAYRQPEESLKTAGFDVLVFVPSMDEENGLVTCGNAVLAGSTPKENPHAIG